MDSSWLSLIFWAVLPVYFLGALTGLLLPKVKFQTLLASLINEPGSITVIPFETKTWTFSLPKLFASQPAKATTEKAAQELNRSWYVDQNDLKIFKDTIEVDTGAKWDLMMEKTLPNLLVYKAWRRTLPNGKTEYKTTTICPDATAEEFMDFYLDDDARPVWDNMITEHSILERGDAAHRELVVRWTRKFPFSFLSDREYTIARRLFRQPAGPSGPESIYGITKAVDLPSHPPTSGVVNTEVFYSMWRSRNVACPWGSGKPACETILLHHEQLKVPENLARFAAKHGMWGFVQKMSTCVAPFVEARRKLCAPHQPDSRPYGFREESNLSAGGLSKIDEERSSSSSNQASTRGRAFTNIATLAVAGTVCVLMKNRSSDNLAALNDAPRRRVHSASQQSIPEAAMLEQSEPSVSSEFKVHKRRRLPRVPSSPYPMW